MKKLLIICAMVLTTLSVQAKKSTDLAPLPANPEATLLTEAPQPRRHYRDAPPRRYYRDAPRRHYRPGPPPRRHYRPGPPPRRYYRHGPPPRRYYRAAPPPRRYYRAAPRKYRRR
ncbi:MAG: hypothetical protein IJM78_01155 [Prevotella sp.]|nr:hypothetical protein [Prevotella sp.]